MPVKGSVASSPTEGQPLQARRWDGQGTFSSPSDLARPTLLPLKCLPLKEEVKLQFPSRLEGIWIC